VRSSEIVVIEGVANYNAFAAQENGNGAVILYFQCRLHRLKAKLEQHGVWVQTLEADATFSGELFLVEGIDKTDFQLNGHRNSTLRGGFQPAVRTFSRGDFIVSLNDPLAYLIFYLLEPESDDGLVFWNLFDDYLAAELADVDAAVEYPVFKVLAN